MRDAFGYRRLFRVAEMVAALTPEGLAGLPFGGTPFLRRLLPRVRLRGEGGGTGEVVPPRRLPPAHERAESWVRGEVLRDEDRIRRRYADDPSPYEGILLPGKPPTAAVLLLSGGKGFVVDAWGPRADALADAVLRRLATRGASVAHFWCTKGRDGFATALRRRGLRTVRRRKAVLVRLLGEDPGILPRPRNWRFRMGDTDGI
jgi:hypothetical protein